MLSQAAKQQLLHDTNPSAFSVSWLTLRRGGVHQGEAKDRFNEIQQELSQLSTNFTNNVMDSVKAYKKVVKDKQDVDGLPPTALEMASQAARSEGFNESTPEAGPWVFTLDIPSYQPVLTHAKNRYPFGPPTVKRMGFKDKIEDTSRHRKREKGHG